MTVSTSPSSATSMASWTSSSRSRSTSSSCSAASASSSGSPSSSNWSFWFWPSSRIASRYAWMSSAGASSAGASTSLMASWESPQISSASSTHSSSGTASGSSVVEVVEAAVVSVGSVVSACSPSSSPHEAATNKVNAASTGEQSLRHGRGPPSALPPGARGGRRLAPPTGPRAQARARQIASTQLTGASSSVKRYPQVSPKVSYSLPIGESQKRSSQAWPSPSSQASHRASNVGSSP